MYSSMLTRPWDEEKLKNLAANFIRLHETITAYFKYEIPFYEIQPDTDTHAHKMKDKLLMVLSRMTLPENALTNEHIHQLHTLVTELNANGADPFYQEMPNGFIDFARLVKKIYYRDYAEMERFIQAVNQEKSMPINRSPVKKIPAKINSDYIFHALFPIPTPNIKNGNSQIHELESPKNNYTPN